MKNTSLITLPKTSLTKVNSKPSRNGSISREALIQFQEIYNEQQKIIHELRLENIELRKELILSDRAPKQIEQSITEINPKEEKERKLQPIGYDKLKQLSGYFHRIFERHVERVQHREAMIYMLHTLYQLKGEAAPHQLFSSADLVEVTGYRYANFLKKARFLEFHPTTKKGFYVLSDIGKQFLQGKITTDKEYCGLIGIVNMNLWK